MEKMNDVIVNHYGKTIEEFDQNEKLLMVADIVLRKLTDLKEKDPEDFETKFKKELKRLKKLRAVIINRILDTDDDLTEEEIEETPYSFAKFIKDQDENHRMKNLQDYLSVASN
jgi:hypothetical protein